MPEPLLTVVVPVGPDETGIPPGLLQDLCQMPADWELIFVGCDPVTQRSLSEASRSLAERCAVQWLFSAPGRAQQMNAGAAAAKGRFLWFVHIDSRFSSELMQHLLDNLHHYPDRLHYCRLAFIADGPATMGLNAWGANLRSKWFGVPFGDQGLALNRALFRQVGGYPQAAYGEDHLLVWRLRQHGVRLCCCEEPMRTSARRYQTRGWLRLTLIYQWRWLGQALPELLRLLRQRYF